MLFRPMPQNQEHSVLWKRLHPLGSEFCFKIIDVSSSRNKPSHFVLIIMSKLLHHLRTGGAGGVSTYEAFLRTDENWSCLKSSQPFDYDITNLKQIQNGVPPPPQFVTDDGGKGNPKCWEKLRMQNEASASLDYDVTLCGGTLGIFIALALQLQGHRVVVVEAGKLLGREQEWNISMKELLELVELGVLTMWDIDEAVKTEFPACRAGFKNEEGEYWLLVRSPTISRTHFYRSSLNTQSHHFKEDTLRTASDTNAKYQMCSTLESHRQSSSRMCPNVSKKWVALSWKDLH
jgi:hypothetical protein